MNIKCDKNVWLVLIKTVRRDYSLDLFIHSHIKENVTQDGNYALCDERILNKAIDFVRAISVV